MGECTKSARFIKICRVVSRPMFTPRYWPIQQIKNSRQIITCILNHAIEPRLQIGPIFCWNKKSSQTKFETTDRIGGNKRLKDTKSPDRPTPKTKRCGTRSHISSHLGSRPCSARFFSGYSCFPLSSKTNISKFQFDLEFESHRFVSTFKYC